MPRRGKRSKASSEVWRVRLAKKSKERRLEGNCLNPHCEKPTNTIMNQTPRSTQCKALQVKSDDGPKINSSANRGETMEMYSTESSTQHAIIPTSQNMDLKVDTPVVSQALYVNNNSIGSSLLRTPDGHKPLSKATHDNVIHLSTSPECSSDDGTVCADTTVHHSVNSTNQLAVSKINGSITENETILGSQCQSDIVKAEGQPARDGKNPSLLNEHGLNTTSETMIKTETGEMELTEKVQVGTPPLKRRRLAECKVEVKVEDDVTTGIPPVPRHVSGLKPHECTVCVEGFTSEHLLIQHLQTVPVETSNSCVKGFDKVNNLVHHINSNTPREPLHETMNPDSLLAHREETDVAPSTSQVTASPQIPQPTSLIVKKMSTDDLTLLVYPCPYCMESYSDVKQLADHIKIHTGNDQDTTSRPVDTVPSTCSFRYQCFDCPLSFKSCLDLMDHAQVHTGIKPYRCTECGESFADFQLYLIHSKSHTIKEKFYCDVCTNWYETEIMLKYHQCKKGEVYNSRRVGLKMKCCNCTMYFHFRLKLLRHFLTHTPVRQYVCTICGQGFMEASRRYLHVNLHLQRGNKNLGYLDERVQSEKDYIESSNASTETATLQKEDDAENDGRRSARVPTVPRHASGNNALKCKSFRGICKENDLGRTHKCRGKPLKQPGTEGTDASSRNKTSYNKCDTCKEPMTKLPHDCKAKLPSENQTAKTGDVALYSCPYCTESYRDVKQLEDHIKIHKGNQQETTSRPADIVLNSSSKGTGYYQCLDCTLSFDFCTNLMHHAQVHTGIKPYCCTDCGKSFANLRLYVDHYKSHDGDGKFHCDECTNWYETKLMLDYHRCRKGDVYNSPVAREEGLRFICCVCRRVYVSRPTMLSHFVTHTSVRRYICTICGLGFMSVKDLSQHVKYHHIRREKQLRYLGRKVQSERNDIEAGDASTVIGTARPTLQGEKHAEIDFRSTGIPPVPRHVSGLKPHECTVCVEGFTSEHLMIQHLQTVPVEACASCVKGFDKVNNPVHHINSNTPRELLDGTMNPDSLLGHREETDVTPSTSQVTASPQIPNPNSFINFQCFDCPMSFVCHTDLMDHAQIHTGIKPYCCTECAESFADVQLYHEHYNSHDKNEKFYCEACSRLCETKVMFDHHQCVKGGVYPPVGGRFKCCNCPRVFISRTALLSHFLTHTPLRTYLCTICGHGAKTTMHLSQHVQWHLRKGSKRPSKNKKQSAMSVQQDTHQDHGWEDGGPDSSAAICPICSQRFSSATECITHVTDGHLKV